METASLQTGCSNAGKVRHLALLKVDSGIRLQAQCTAQSWAVVAVSSAFYSLGDSMEVCSPEVGLESCRWLCCRFQIPRFRDPAEAIKGHLRPLTLRLK